MRYLISLLISLCLVTPALADKAYFVAPWVNGSADFDINKIAYEIDGKRTGGWVVASYCPDSTVIVLVHTSEEYMATLKADKRYIWIETVEMDNPPAVLPVKVKGGSKHGSGKIDFTPSVDKSKDKSYKTDMEEDMTKKQKEGVEDHAKIYRKMSNDDVKKFKLNKRKDLKDEMLKLHNLGIKDYLTASIN